jgi:hypothetical protein
MGACGNVNYGSGYTGTYGGNAETAKPLPKVARATFLSKPEYPVGCRGDRARLLCWYSFEISLLRRARVLTNLKPTRSTRLGEGMEVRRSPQAVAGRKRYVEELGRPHALLAVGSSKVRYTAIEARKGKPGHRVRRGT